MIRLARCTQASKAGTYFRLHLQSGDSPAQPAAPVLTLKAAWTGSALPLVGLSPYEPPAASHLVRLGRGLHPTDKARLAPRKNRKRAYYDLTVTAPKTVTLLALLEPNHPVAKSVMHAHLAAVTTVIRNAGRMIQPQNARGAPTARWLGAVFHHTHTREGDPHLHSHVILPNLMYDAAGQWRAMQVVIAGPNRLKLGLVYGHALAIHLRRLGFGPEIAMLDSGLPEIRCLQPLARRYAKARRAVLKAAAERPAKSGGRGPRRQQGAVARVFPASHYDTAALEHRQRLADELRKPKRKAADDPVKLTREAERWSKELNDQDYRTLRTLLDGLDYTRPQQPAVVPPREGPPPAVRDLMQSASYLVPEGVKTTLPILMRGAVTLSAGRHSWHELFVGAQAKMARRKKALARIRATMEADSIAIAQAEIEAANRRAAARVPQPAPTPPPPSAGQTPDPPAPADAAPVTPPARSPKRGR